MGYLPSMSSAHPTLVGVVLGTRSCEGRQLPVSLSLMNANLTRSAACCPKAKAGTELLSG